MAFHRLDDRDLLGSMLRRTKHATHGVQNAMNKTQNGSNPEKVRLVSLAPREITPPTSSFAARAAPPDAPRAPHAPEASLTPPASPSPRCSSSARPSNRSRAPASDA